MANLNQNVYLQRVRDKVNNFEGTVTGICFYMTGCTQFLVEGPLKEKDGDTNNKWIDMDRLEFVNVEKAKPETRGYDAGTRPGGPQADALQV